MELKITADVLSDLDVEAFTMALDDDGHGELSTDELLDFVDRGAATLYAGPVGYLLL